MNKNISKKLARSHFLCASMINKRKERPSALRHAGGFMIQWFVPGDGYRTVTFSTVVPLPPLILTI